MTTEVSIFCWRMLVALLGACIGSFLNVIIYRVPLMIQKHDEQFINEHLFLRTGKKERGDDRPLNIIFPRSGCPSCRENIAFYDNIPLISWMLLGGRCRHCNTKISWQYPAVEMVMMLIALGLAWDPVADWSWIYLLVFSAILISLAAIDFRHLILPDCLTGSLLWSGLLWQSFYNQMALNDAIIGVIAGYLSLRIISHSAEYLTGKECMGQGDWKMLAALGAWFGWQSLPEVVLIASGTSILALLLLFRNTKAIRQMPFPFGPGLALAGLMMMARRILGG